MKHKGPITIIRKSCLTGKAVWIYRGPSKNAARIAYWRACKKEIDRVKHWGNVVAQQCSNAARFLADCMAEIPINAELTPEQAEAARKLQSIAKREKECYRDFYEHIMEERRRREEDKEYYRKLRERKLEENTRYDK